MLPSQSRHTSFRLGRISPLQPRPRQTPKYCRPLRQEACLSRSSSLASSRTRQKRNGTVAKTSTRCSVCLAPSRRYRTTVMSGVSRVYFRSPNRVRLSGMLSRDPATPIELPWMTWCFSRRSIIRGAPSSFIAHSTSSSARSIRPKGTSIPSAIAVLRLINNSNLTGAWIGSSPGLAPFRMRST
jgi:hypothetical protein